MALVSSVAHRFQLPILFIISILVTIRFKTILNISLFFFNLICIQAKLRCKVHRDLAQKIFSKFIFLSLLVQNDLWFLIVRFLCWTSVLNVVSVKPCETMLYALVMSKIFKSVRVWCETKWKIIPAMSGLTDFLRLLPITHTSTGIEETSSRALYVYVYIVYRKIVS